MQKGNLIGTGRTAEVFEWGEDRILKLYFNWDNAEFMYNREMENTVEVNRLKLPAPYMYDALELEGRKGMIFERLFGSSLLGSLRSKPMLAVHYAGKMAKLHLIIHESVSEKLTPVKDQLSYGIKAAAGFAPFDAQFLLNILDSLPDMKNVCHGDFHPDNIMVTKKGLMIIDWMNAAAGDPASDVARTLLMIKTPYLPPNVSKFMAGVLKRLRKIFFSTYLKKYTSISGMTPDHINDWLLPVAAARLIEQVPGEKEWLVRIITEQRNIYNI